MGQIFEPYDPDQAHLFPPSPADWLPEGHLAHFVAETVDALDLKPFVAKYLDRDDGRGSLAYHPRMLLRVLIYSYSVGVFSSRKIAQGIEDLVALRYLAGGNQPSHRTISRFRQENIEHFEKLFVEIVRVARRAGLIKLGTVAIDGTKIHANANKHKAMSYGRMCEEQERLRKEIKRITQIAQGVDEAEDKEFGPDFRGDELPAELRTRAERRAKIRSVMKQLEEEQAQEDAAQKRVEPNDKSGQSTEAQRKNGTPPDKKQRNFTDPESRMMMTGGKTFDQCYNAQAAVDAKEQIIVAVDVSSAPLDNCELIAMTDAVRRNCRRTPKRVLADAGYKSEANITALEKLGIDVYVALGRGEKRREGVNHSKPATRRMARKLSTKRGRARYKLRKTIIEPAFGWAKQVLGFRSFLMRGLRKVKGEWNLVCLALNLRRMNTKMGWS